MSSLSDFWLTEYDEWDFIDDARHDEENTNDDNSIMIMIVKVIILVN